MYLGVWGWINILRIFKFVVICKVIFNVVILICLKYCCDWVIVRCKMLIKIWFYFVWNFYNWFFVFLWKLKFKIFKLILDIRLGIVVYIRFKVILNFKIIIKLLVF